MIDSVPSSSTELEQLAQAPESYSLATFERAHAAGIPVEYLGDGGWIAKTAVSFQPLMRYRFKPGIEVRNGADPSWLPPDIFSYTVGGYEWRIKPEAPQFRKLSPQEQALMPLLVAGWLTPVEALEKVGVMALSQRMGSIARAGYAVQKQWKDLPTGKRVMSYRIAP